MPEIADLNVHHLVIFTFQYYGADAVDGKFRVTRPSIKESNTDLRGSSKRLSRIGSTTGVFEDEPEYPPPIMDTPAAVDSVLKRQGDSFSRGKSRICNKYNFTLVN